MIESTPLAPWIEMWLLVAIVSALIRTGQSTLSKWLTDEHTGLELTWGTAVVAAVAVAPVAAWSAATTPLQLSPWVVAVAVVAGCVELVALYMWLEAFQSEDLSVVSPLRQMVPIFVVVLEPLFLGVAFDIYIALGAVLTAVGAYVVLVDESGVLAPVSRITERGPQLALASALLFAIASVKAGYLLDTVPSAVYAFYIYTWIGVGLSLILWKRGDGLPVDYLRRPRFVSLGVVASMVTLTTFITLTLTPAVSQAVVAFRASILFNIAIGGLLFKESGLAQRFIGATLIIIGIAAAVL